MSDQSRALPDRPSLRYLKLEAKRRLSAGEFATLQLAQLAIAREHGLPSWTALKEQIEAAGPASHALTQVRWVMSRFAAADTPGWTPPDEEELRGHFDDDYLSLLPPGRLSGLLGSVAGQLREDLVDVRAEPRRLRARVAGLRVEAATGGEPPYRLRELRFYPLETKVADPRLEAPETRASGVVPAEADSVAAESFAELGLVGLMLAGGNGDGSVWVTARGWADLDQGDVLLPDHRFPAYSITQLVTATAVLRLVADGLVRLDAPANAYLRTIRLADDDVTVRHLLSHAGGVDSPASMFAGRVPELVSVTGPAASCNGRRGTFGYGYGEYAMLGQLIADVTGTRYEDAATSMVLRPLGMTASWFPRGRPVSRVVMGHHLTDEGVFERAPARLSVAPASGGLWTAAADLVRFGLGWSSLLPGALAREALQPQAEFPGGAAGLGWMLVPPKDVAGHPGAGPGFSASLVIRPGTGQTWVILTNRRVLVEPINERLIRPLT
ncbi:hypothetical protein Aph01nite_10030 [Acrocarpospora phusangensis]|uniref:Beta-lactamase-related domain-containing protein n=1 Tax=Acrocarpospora phusangensis TaxID=1070424 RepID=A0A919Q882_9ACTN|nr:serine hydrolase domain-containing protein [Acrocarpospora phusangensis]GIH22693.1 hypothetical protein Aph01nite_10030 [Acrocarpospora phusangensis]